MSEFFLDLFGDDVSINELFVDSGEVTIARVGDARFEISTVCNNGRQLAWLVWTTRKSRIELLPPDLADWAVVDVDEHGNVQSLRASDCSMHFEHLDRGVYYLELTHVSREFLQLTFRAHGYLRTKVLRHLVPAEHAD
ncbi:MAG: hypothetical protein KDI71_05040 [Xanthomonadales bacterium]|nr:hypothetical protein [Xanthomonadales bacterium]